MSASPCFIVREEGEGYRLLHFQEGVTRDLSPPDGYPTPAAAFSQARCIDRYLPILRSTVQPVEACQ